MERRFTNNVGFEYSLQAPSLRQEGIKLIEDPLTTGGNSWDLIDKASSFNGQNAQKTIARGCKAYVVDGFVRMAVDRHAELFKDFDLGGRKEAVDYLKRRLNLISLKVGEPWQLIITRYVHEYFKHGNPFFLKTRGTKGGDVNVKRPLYEEKPYAISGIFIVHPLSFEPFVKDSVYYGWKFNKAHAQEKISTVSGEPLPSNQALISRGLRYTGKETVFKNGVDLIHTPYKRPSDCHYGFGLTFAALEDVSLLRNQEQTTAIALKKNTIPVLWHRILRPSTPGGDSELEMRNALASHRNMSQAGVIVTPGTHELKILGSESQVLRTEGYLKYGAYRAFAGLGVSPFLMGFEPGTIGTAEAAIELLMNRIRFCQQELATNLEMFLLNELLWEGGFDPYNKEEDQVKLIFKEMDEARLIKLRAHFTDMITKNSITFEEGRREMGYLEKVNFEDLYYNRVTIPIEKAKAEAKAAAAPDTTTKPPKPTKKKVESFFVENFGKIRLDEFVDEFNRAFDVNIDETIEGLTNLAHDPEAVLLYLHLLIDEAYKE